MFNPFKFILIGGLKLYKFTLSPVFYALGIRCRHLPSCSEYSRQAVERHGAWAGAWMSLARLSRCHSFGTDGVDNVPELVTKPPLWAPWRYGRWRRKYID